MTDKSILQAYGINSAFHYAPLHYLLFIARDRALFSKSQLLRRGYPESHFRSTSWRQDRVRGFGEYVHLTTTEFPDICRAKLSRGFPHFTIRIPVGAIESRDFDLCRYNIAKTRCLRRDGMPGRAEEPANGYYYEDKQIPIARGGKQCSDLLSANHGLNMIEVLVPNEFRLPNETVLIFHHSEDLKTAERFLRKLESPWERILAQPQHRYTPSESYRKQVSAFLERSFADPIWKGDGLEFDRV